MSRQQQQQARRKNGRRAAPTRKPRTTPPPAPAPSAGQSNGNGRVDTEATTTQTTARLPVLKTYKIYIGGKFPRTESGRYYVIKDAKGAALANVCLSSRKDFREAVVAARAAQPSWAGKSAYNRGQILYRIAEMLEGRAGQFVEELTATAPPGSSPAARAEVERSIDRLLYYAGWSDKYQQVFSSVNPVASSHFNFSMLEPTGVVSIISPEETGLIGLISTIAPTIVGGNSCVALASTSKPLAAVTLAEVLATSDLPGGVVNILTGERKELLEHFSAHMDVNATIYCGPLSDPAAMRELATVRTKAANNVKRAISYDRAGDDWMAENAQSPYFILDTQEVKTTWHPVGV
jgi:acyl-CoA reductase-like NAD-dependent aldehyde dehydrogenase